ncbi:hypothetical protein [Exiguobacterium algae]|uniref:hypothetical protein n=1 Tax=Exiguobacterium algae TaxID=2751250 RepID=UPI001BE5309E|nr:hypothetical protein [Exiguobacterium algae]
MREELIRWMRSGRVTELMYVDRHGVFTKRRVKLIKIQGQHVIAWDYSKHAKRTFCIDQVLACLPAIDRRKSRMEEIS